MWLHIACNRKIHGGIGIHCVVMLCWLSWRKKCFYRYKWGLNRETKITHYSDPVLWLRWPHACVCPLGFKTTRYFTGKPGLCVNWFKVLHKHQHRDSLKSTARHGSSWLKVTVLDGWRSVSRRPIYVWPPRTQLLLTTTERRLKPHNKETTPPEVKLEPAIRRLQIKLN